jgi:hypothetical protein
MAAALAEVDLTTACRVHGPHGGRQLAEAETDDKVGEVIHVEVRLVSRKGEATYEFWVRRSKRAAESGSGSGWPPPVYLEQV